MARHPASDVGQICHRQFLYSVYRHITPKHTMVSTSTFN
jgi:hypothetical protein